MEDTIRAYYDSFTSRGQLGSKIQKARAWGRRTVHAPCLICRVDCGRAELLATHVHNKHKH